MIEYLQLGSTIATISLSIALGTLTIISNQQNVYHLILTISSFIIPLYSIIPIIYSNVISISIQLIFSIFNIISGILFIINVPHKQLYYIPITIIFIVNLVFLIASFIMLLLWMIILKTGLNNTNEESEIYLNDLISKKTSEATLYNTNPAIIANNINTEPSSEYSMENDWINSKDKITLALPPNATPINCDFSYYLGSNANSVRGDLDNARSILMVNLEDQDTKANQQLKRQRWKSIHDEKIMIANLNQNLLPGVLKQNISDDYSNTLTGLENIPSSTNLTTAIVRKIDGTPTNIPEINMEELNNLQHISGYNIIDGSSNLIDGSQLFDKKTSIKSELYQGEYLLPPNEVVENIDQLSDITSKRPSILNRSFSEPSLYENGAPSLYTFRKSSSPKPIITPVSTNIEEFQFENENKLAPEPKTPPQQQQQQSRSRQPSTRTSPIRKFLHDSSPKRIFKSRSVVGPHFHKHSNSTISNTMSLKSSFSSSRSTSPNKLKSILKLHKHSTSVPNFQFHDNSWTHSHPHQQHSWYLDKHSFHSSHHLKVIAEPIDLWDIQTTNFDINDVYEVQPFALAQPPQISSSSSAQPKEKESRTKKVKNNEQDKDDDEDDEDEHHQTNQESRISSLPSQVFGEYDKEKWDTLKTLGNENSHTVAV